MGLQKQDRKEINLFDGIYKLTNLNISTRTSERGLIPSIDFSLNEYLSNGEGLTIEKNNSPITVKISNLYEKIETLLKNQTITQQEAQIVIGAEKELLKAVAILAKADGHSIDFVED